MTLGGGRFILEVCIFLRAVELQIEKSEFAFSIAVAENSRLFM